MRSSLDINHISQAHNTHKNLVNCWLIDTAVILKINLTFVVT